MSIEKYFKEKITVQRLTAVSGTDKEQYTTLLSNVPCRIESQGDENIMLSDGAFYKMFRMFCGIIDIGIGDRVVKGNDTYCVKGIAEYDSYSAIKTGNGYHHLEIILALPK